MERNKKRIGKDKEKYIRETIVLDEIKNIKFAIVIPTKLSLVNEIQINFINSKGEMYGTTFDSKIKDDVFGDIDLTNLSGRELVLCSIISTITARSLLK